MTYWTNIIRRLFILYIAFSITRLNCLNFTHNLIKAASAFTDTFVELLMALVRKSCNFLALTQKEYRVQVSFFRLIKNFTIPFQSLLLFWFIPLTPHKPVLSAQLFWHQFLSKELNAHMQTQRDMYKVPTWTTSVETDLCFCRWGYLDVRNRIKILKVKNCWITSVCLTFRCLDTLWEKYKILLVFFLLNKRYPFC